MRHRQRSRVISYHDKKWFNLRYLRSTHLEEKEKTKKKTQLKSDSSTMNDVHLKFLTRH